MVLFAQATNLKDYKMTISSIKEIFEFCSKAHTVRDALLTECTRGVEQFRDIEFSQRMYIAGLYYQSLSLSEKWDVLINLDDDFIHEVIGKAMIGDKSINFNTIGSVLTTAIYTRIEDRLLDLFIDAYQENKVVEREAEEPYRNSYRSSLTSRGMEFFY